MQVGDIVYFYEYWSDSIEKGKIEELKNVNGLKAAEVRNIGVVDSEGKTISNAYGTSTRYVENLYPSAASAYSVYFEKSIKQKRQYIEKIKTVRDLVDFPLNHCLCGDEYTDYDAKAAYKQRVKELLNIDLDMTPEMEMDEKQ